MNNYELLLILTEAESAFDRAKSLLKDAGANIVKEDVWGMRRLAYPIKKYDSGFYAILNVDLPRQASVALNRKLNLEDSVLRAIFFEAKEEKKKVLKKKVQKKGGAK